MGSGFACEWQGHFPIKKLTGAIGIPPTPVKIERLLRGCALYAKLFVHVSSITPLAPAMLVSPRPIDCSGAAPSTLIDYLFDHLIDGGSGCDHRVDLVVQRNLAIDNHRPLQ